MVALRGHGEVDHRESPRPGDIPARERYKFRNAAGARTGATHRFLDHPWRALRPAHSVLCRNTGTFSAWWPDWPCPGTPRDPWSRKHVARSPFVVSRLIVYTTYHTTFTHLTRFTRAPRLVCILLNNFLDSNARDRAPASDVSYALSAIVVC